MAQSRVQQGKGKKSKFPMWGIAIIVVAVVAVAGYAIIRFSKASTQFFVKTADSGLQGGTQTITKESGKRTREVGKIPVYAEFSYDQVMGAASGGVPMKTACVYSYMVANTNFSVWLQSAGVFGTPITSYRNQYRTATRDWQQTCIEIDSGFKNALTNLYNIYKTKPSMRLYITEDNPDVGYIGVQQMWLTTN